MQVYELQIFYLPAGRQANLRIVKPACLALIANYL